MKGQLTIQYLVSFVIFIGLVTYIYLAYSNNVPQFLDEIRKENQRSEAFQISETLLNNILADETQNKQNFISMNEIKDLNQSLQTSEIKDIIGSNENCMLIISEVNLDNGDRIPLLSYVPSSGMTTSIEAKVTRYATYIDNGNIKLAEIIVQTYSSEIPEETTKPTIPTTTPVCSCGLWSDWNNIGCGESPCSPGQMKQARTRTCTPSGCDIESESRCVDDSCTNWITGNCGRSCEFWQREQTRTCTYDCLPETQCTGCDGQCCDLYCAKQGSSSSICLLDRCLCLIGPFPTFPIQF